MSSFSRLGTSVAALMVGASPAYAQEASARADASENDEIVVTAQRRGEKLIDVPMSITVLSGDQLDKSSSEGVVEALRSVPGVVTNSVDIGGGQTVSIRGVGAAGTNFNGSTPIAYYLDSAPFALVKGAIVPDISGYDLDRVEVVRGPQGTLYGASALGGVVRVITAAPAFDAFELKSRASVAVTKHGSPSTRVDAAVNVPLVEDALAVRGVFGFQKLGGWIDRPNGGGRDANDADILNGRLRLSARLAQRLGIDLSVVHYNADIGAPPTSIDNRVSPLRPEPTQTKYTIYAANVTYDFDHFSLSSATSLIDFKLDGINDRGPILNTIREADMFSEEVSLTSTDTGPWRWSLGAMYRVSKDSVVQDFGPFTPKAPANWLDRSESKTVFGEVTRVFMDGHLEATAGLRYFEDEVTQREMEDFALNTPSPSDDGLDFSRDKFSKLTPRFVLTWHPSDSLTTYASYAEGFRSGSQQTPVALLTAPELAPLEADLLKNYEVGMHGEFFGGLLRADAALYYMDWRDIQQPLQVPFAGGATFVTANVNGPSASGLGFDIALVAKPMKGLTLSGGFSRNYLKQDEDVISRGVVLFPKGTPVGIGYTGSASVDYVTTLGRGDYEASFSAGAYMIGRSSFYTSTGASASSDDLIIARANFAVGARDRWTASVFVDNVFNKGGIQNAGPGTAQNVFAKPRTIGLQLEFGM